MRNFSFANTKYKKKQENCVDTQNYILINAPKLFRQHSFRNAYQTTNEGIAHDNPKTRMTENVFTTCTQFLSATSH